MIWSQLAIILHGPDTDDGTVDVRCALADQDTSKRKPCPFGQTALMTSIKALAGFDVSGEQHVYDNDVFTVPILIQDRSGFASTLSLSHGSLSEKEFITKNASVNIELSASDAEASGLDATPWKVDLFEKIKDAAGLEPDVIRTAQTPGKLYNASGETVYQSGQLLQVSDDFLLLKDKVYGVVAVAYTVSGYQQIASIPPRDEESENNYQSTLWIASSCGGVQNFAIEIPDCWQNAWWNKNGWPDVLGGDDDGGDDGGDDVTISSPYKATPKDVSLRWELCGDKKAADNDTERFFADLPGSGPICYPGVRESDIQEPDCDPEN